jgi:pantetheine-phosphate adenylyltransferase
MFDELIIAVAANPEKTPLFDLAEREALVRRSVRRMRKVQVVTFRGLLVDLTKELGAVAILRGIRAVSDFEFEFQMALANRELHAGAESIYLMPSIEHIFISSTIIKNIARHGGSVHPFVPAHVERKLTQRFSASHDRA